MSKEADVRESTQRTLGCWFDIGDPDLVAWIRQNGGGTLAEWEKAHEKLLKERREREEQG